MSGWPSVSGTAAISRMGLVVAVLRAGALQVDRDEAGLMPRGARAGHCRLGQNPSVETTGSPGERR